MPHNRQKAFCRECGGSQICEHGRRRRECRECGGSQICEHDRIRRACRECGGSQICEHDRIRRKCWGCNGCVHKRVKNECKFCGTGAYCGRCHKRGRKRGGKCPHYLDGAPPVRWVTQFWNPAWQLSGCSVQNLRRKSLRRCAPRGGTMSTWPR